MLKKLLIIFLILILTVPTISIGVSGDLNDYEPKLNEEGCEFITLTNPVEYIADEKGRVKQVRVQKMELGEPDASGRRRPVPVEGSEYLIDADVVVVAVGVSPNPIVPRSVAGLEVSKKGTIVVNDATMQSNLPEFYAGGDIVRGGATVILAMGDGRRAAAHMDAQLRS